MSLEHDPARSEPAAATGTGMDGSPRGPPDASDYWHALIDEKAAAAFLDLTDRTMQAMRQRGGGPRFVRISARCVKYRRIDLKSYVDARLRSSTSDCGEAA